MDLTFARALDGKFFINMLQSQHGGQALLRGQILGPIAMEMSPYYLCDLYPANDAEIGITSQTILSLEQLAGVYLYADRATQDAAWAEVQRQRQAALLARQQAQEAEAAAGGSPVFGTLHPTVAAVLGLQAPEESATDEDATPPAKPKRRRRRKPTKKEVE